MGRVVRALKHGWNAFGDAPRDLDPTWVGGSMTGSPRQNRSPRRYVNDKSIIGSIYTRLALDVAGVEFYHCKLDENAVPVEVIYDGLNECLTLNPNIDQSAMAFKMDAALTMFEVGHCAIIPTETTNNPIESASYDIQALRVGRVVAWYPRKVTVELYDDREVNKDGRPAGGGVVKQLTVPKDMVSIIENPFYSSMNEPSGTLQRLLLKLQMMDGLDETVSSGKLDLIFQMAYAVRTETKKQQADKRRQELREQLMDDELGIGYIDASEKVIQLNRPIENKLLTQIEYLTKELFTNLSLTPEIMNGTASREVMNNYFDRTIEPIANSLALEMKRKFLTKTARTQGHSLEIYKDPLKLIPIDELAEVADKLIRNAVVTSNEFRPKIGYRPSKDPNANKLQNPNMPIDDQLGGQETVVKKEKEEPDDPGLRRVV